MNIKRNIIFTLEKRKQAGNVISENVPIRMRVTYCGQRVELMTGFRIDASKWESERQQVKNGCTNKLKQSSAEINAALQSRFAVLQDVFKGFELEETLPTAKELKEEYGRRIKADDVNTVSTPVTTEFFDAFDAFVKECGRQNDWTKATYEKFASVKRHLSDFRNRLTFGFFDEDGLGEYVEFLRTEEGLRNSTIGKQMGFLKWFLRWGFRKGLHHNNAYDTFKPKLKTTQKKIIFLTWEELTKLREFAVPKNRKGLERVRDIFLFQCFTGLRYSDVFNLRRSDVKEDHIEVTTIKTSDSLIIELNQHSKAILDKYKDIPFDENKALPVISNQKMNDELKVLGELAGIDEPVRQTYYKGNERIDEVQPKYAVLSTHAGRRTFICNALALGIAPQVVMKWTGHSDYKAMKPYIDVADEVKAQAMNKFDQL